MTPSFGFYGDEIHFLVVWPIILTQGPAGGACIAQPRWMPARRILGGGRAHGISF